MDVVSRGKSSDFFVVSIIPLRELSYRHGDFRLEVQMDRGRDASIEKCCWPAAAHSSLDGSSRLESSRSQTVTPRAVDGTLCGMALGCSSHSAVHISAGKGSSICARHSEVRPRQPADAPLACGDGDQRSRPRAPLQRMIAPDIIVH